MSSQDETRSYELVWTDTFTRTARKYLRKHPNLRGIFKDILSQLEIDPSAPRLRMHRLKGKHRNKHSVRLTYSDRIILFLKLTEKEIILLDVGTHDEVYRDA
ncbi:MAG: plasmid stabilization protein [Planctomycetes bacterium]|nr:plasmid stabilization protein [Planctomycetota bacterium]